MTPEEQVKEIIKLMSPEDPTTTDALFLVQRYMENSRAALSAKDKQIALTEAKLELEQLNRHTAVNNLLVEKNEKLVAIEEAVTAAVMEAEMRLASEILNAAKEIEITKSTEESKGEQF